MRPNRASKGFFKRLVEHVERHTQHAICRYHLEQSALPVVKVLPKIGFPQFGCFFLRHIHLRDFSLNSTSTSSWLIPSVRRVGMISASAGRLPLRRESATSLSSSHFGFRSFLVFSQKPRQSCVLT